MSGLIEVPREEFLGLVEGFLNEGRSLYLFVGPMTEKKDFGCDYCGAKIEAWSPDDYHTNLELKADKDSIERKIKCPKCEKENTRYWSGPHFSGVVVRRG